MGRGLGPRQESIMRALKMEDGLYVSDFMGNARNLDERRLVLAAIRGLKARGLVRTTREPNTARVTPVGTRTRVVYDVAANSTTTKVGPRFIRHISESTVWLVK